MQTEQIYERVNELSRRMSYFVHGEVKQRERERKEETENSTAMYCIRGIVQSLYIPLPRPCDSRLVFVVFAMQDYATTTKDVERQERILQEGVTRRFWIKLLPRHEFNESRREAAPRCR